MYSATQELIEWLVSKGYSAYSYPPKSGDSFFTVERTGGAVVDMVDHPEFAVQAWARNIVDAEEMCLTVRELLVSGDVPTGFYKVSADGMYHWYDEDTRLPRYQLVIECTTQLTE